MDVLIGVDVGQKVDPTAIAVVQRQERDGQEHYLAHHLERLTLGTPYPLVAERLATIVRGVQGRTTKQQIDEPVFATRQWAFGEYQEFMGTVVQLRDVNPSVHLFVDATGLGQPVVDLLAVTGCRPVACYFTHGDRRHRDGYQVSIGKAWLVSRLQVLLQQHRIHLPNTDEARVLARELQDYEIRVDQDANDRYGAFKVGSHDDLVTALGLAVQPLPPRWAVLD